MRYSSDIGMAIIGLSVGEKKMHNYLESRGFGQITSVPVVENKGMLRSARDWRDSDVMTISFGQSISVTGLQMAQAYLTLLNGGEYKPLRLLREETRVTQKQQIFSADVSRQVMSMMRSVVQENGTGTRARIPGVDVAGKTGTAQKVDQATRTYGKKRLASFVGFVPAQSPRYLVISLVDEPAVNSYGGVVAAPVFREVATKTMTYGGQLTEVQAQAAAQQKQKAVPVGRATKMQMKTVAFQEKTTAAARVKSRSNVAEREAARAWKEVVAEGNSDSLSANMIRGGAVVPDVVGKSLRNAVEAFARSGVVPVLKGVGQRVVRQFPEAGKEWPESGKVGEYVLWLSER